MAKSQIAVGRAIIAGGTLAGGILLARFLLLAHYSLTPGIVIIAIILAAIVGIGKLASP